jgi:hypothetical protein
MKGSEERDRLIQRLADMKAKFNDLVKTKADL